MTVRKTEGERRKVKLNQSKWCLGTTCVKDRMSEKLWEAKLKEKLFSEMALRLAVRRLTAAHGFSSELFHKSKSFPFKTATPLSRISPNLLENFRNIFVNFHAWLTF